jgi:hypothetical protein
VKTRYPRPSCRREEAPAFVQPLDSRSSAGSFSAPRNVLHKGEHVKTDAYQLPTGHPVQNVLSLCRQGLLPSGKRVTGASCATGLTSWHGAIGTAASQAQVGATHEESFTEAWRIHDLNEPVASVADAAPSAGQRLGHDLRSADHRTGELWETLSYVAIWLCGLIGICLCFV